MPELPDVEVFKRYLEGTSLSRQIRDVGITDKRVLEGTSPRKLKQALSGKSFRKTRRHGKCLFVHMGKSIWLLLHFGMTGYLLYGDQSEENHKHARAIFYFEGGTKLQFVCLRLLGRVSIVRSVDDYIRRQEMGPDALSVDLETLREKVSGARGAVKSTLMNQSLLAGIGNIYSDEILFHSRILPQTGVKKLHDKQVKELHRNMVKVLRKAVEKNVEPGRFPRTWLLPHRDKGQNCPKCGQPIATKKVSGRTAYFCGKCQS